jgi:leader peptidase (prepilin peptidase)/N-methyltransferase
MGLFLGEAVAAAMLFALVVGALAGALVIARKGARAGRKTAIPFGPFLAAGAVAAVFAGQPVVDFYINHFVH